MIPTMKFRWFFDSPHKPHILQQWFESGYAGEAGKWVGVPYVLDMK